MCIRISLRALGRFGRDRRGATLPMIAVGVSALVGAGAVAVDAAQLYATRGDLQATADAASRSSAWGIPDATTVTQDAIDYATENMPPETHGEVLVAGDVTLGTWDYIDRTFTAGVAGSNAVRLVTRRASQNQNPVPLIFARVFSDDTSDVTAEAIAAKIDIDACVLSMAGSGTGLLFDGGVLINSPDCGFAGNSLSPDAALITNGASGSVSIESLYLAGGMEDPHGVIHSTEPPVVKARRQFDDPYAEREFNDFPTSNSTTWNENSTPSNTVDLEPGVYPNGFDFKGDVNMAPGVYVMQGDVSMGSQTNVVGDGVTIVLDNSDIDVTGGATTDITAPTTGSTAGIAIMRQGPASSSKMAGGSAMTVNGAVYMPNSDLDYAGNSSPGGCLQVIANRVNFSGNTALSNNCAAAGTNNITMSFTMLVK